MNQKMNMYPKAIEMILHPKFNARSFSILLSQTHPDIFCDVADSIINEKVAYQHLNVAAVASVAAVAPASVEPVTSVAPVAAVAPKKRKGRPFGALGKKTLARMALATAKAPTVIDAIYEDVPATVATPVKVRKVRTAKAVKEIKIADPKLIHYSDTERAFIITSRASGLGSPEIASLCNKLFHKGKEVRTKIAVYSLVSKNNKKVK